MVYLNPVLIDRDGASWGEEPQFHTPGREFVYPGRKVLVLPLLIWEFTPEECPGQPDHPTQWLFDDTVLVCTACGLDST